MVASSAPPTAVLPAPLPGPALGPSPLSLNPSLPPTPTLPPGNQSANDIDMSNPLPAPPPPPDLILPDDVPNPSQLKMSPIGQIVKSSGASGGTKKKSKVVVEGGVGGGSVAGDTAAAAAGPPAASVAVGMSGTRFSDSGAPKKKKGVTGVGTGNGRKKNVPPSFPPPMVVG